MIYIKQFYNPYEGNRICNFLVIIINNKNIFIMEYLHNSFWKIYLNIVVISFR